MTRDEVIAMQNAGAIFGAAAFILFAVVLFVMDYRYRKPRVKRRKPHARQFRIVTRRRRA